VHTRIDFLSDAGGVPIMGRPFPKLARLACEPERLRRFFSLASS
jgi:hypothetical protein